MEGISVLECGVGGVKADTGYLILVKKEKRRVKSRRQRSEAGSQKDVFDL
jgi:hypothetical protein